ncbi:unnamed protein product [Amoebophrya sp. A120]|nr:unnamed protein product [Amoebophrya sp. A120]|eukprot:GSA120T00009458001.1
MLRASRCCRCAGTILWRPRSGLEGGGYKKRIEQGRGIGWFVDAAHHAAPSLEFFSLPRMSLFPLLMRIRSAQAKCATEGPWMALQVRNTEVAYQNAAKGDMLCEVRHTSFSRYPDMPLIVTSIPTKSLFVLETPHFRERFKLSLTSESEHRLQVDRPEHMQLLAARLVRLYEVAMACSTSYTGSLFSLMEAAATSTALRRNRRVLVEVMQLPVFSELQFPVETQMKPGAHNATLRGLRVTFRATTEYFRGGASGNLPVQIFLPNVVDTDGFLFLVADDPANKMRLTRIGLVPNRVVVDRGLLNGMGRRGTSRYVRWSPTSENSAMDDTFQSQEIIITGSSFSGLDSYFISVEAGEHAIHAFATRILAEIHASKAAPPIGSKLDDDGKCAYQ